MVKVSLIAWPLVGGWPGAVRHPGIRWPSGALLLSTRAGGEEDFAVGPEKAVQITSAAWPVIRSIPRNVVPFDHGLINVPGHVVPEFL